jgi:S1-C subfamily serine protease
MSEEDGRAWTCDACGRKVPPHIDRCRCGAERAAGGPAPDVVEVAEPEESAAEPQRSPSLFVVAAALLAVLVAVLAYRTGGFSSGPSPSTAPAAAVSVPAPQVGPAGDAQPPPAGQAPTLKIELPPDLQAQLAQSARSQAVPPPATEPIGSSAVEDVVQRVIPAVLLIDSDAGRGTGFFAAPGLVLTNAHVVGSLGTVTLRMADGQAVSGQVLRTVASIDLAIIRPDRVSPTQVVLPLRSASEARVGQEVLAVGSALGVLQNTVTRGIVSAIRNVGGVTLIQTDAAVNPGNSGGPLLDRQGYVIGVTTMKVSGQAESLGFAVASDHARALFEGRSDQATSSGGTLQERLQATMTGDLRGSGDRSREEATVDLEKRLKSIAEVSNQIDSYWKDYRPACLRSTVIPRGFEREWFVLFDKGVNPNPACSAWTADLMRAVQQVRTAMSDSLGAARRAGVLPGDLRNLCRTYRLEWEGW